MAQLAIAAEPWAERKRRTAELRKRLPFARELLDFYGALLPVQESAHARSFEASPPARSVAAYVAEMVVPSVVDVSMAAGPDRLRSAMARRMEGGEPRDMIERLMRGEDQPAVDRFIAMASLGPVLEALGPEAGAACAGPRDARHCPQCGGLPQLSYTAQAADDLATGPRYLLCSRCHASWGYPRMTCAGCGEDSSARLPIFTEEGTSSGERGSVVRGLPTGAPARNGKSNGHGSGDRSAVFPHVRVETCDTCHHYLLSVDLAADPRAVPLVDELASLPLDIYAQERGFSKITPNVMGF